MIEQAYVLAMSVKKNINMRKYRKKVLLQLDMSDDEDLTGVLPEKSSAENSNYKSLTDKSNPNYDPDNGKIYHISHVKCHRT